jgi:zinc resistance-associated protein
MLKTVLAGIAALSISGASLAGASLAHAQATSQATPPSTPSADAQQRWRPSAEDAAALVDARVAALKAGLKLSTEQEKHWPAVETAIRDLAKQRADRMAERRDARASGNAPQRPDAIERLRRGADAMTTRAASLKRLADAAEPLYQSLDDGQKRRFGMLLRMGGEPRMRGHWRHRADNAR